MHGPPLVGWLLALVCAGTGAYCLATRGRATAEARETARMEAAMGLGMALMALPGAAGVLPSGTFLFLFGTLTVWGVAMVVRALPAAGGRGAHLRHGLHHTLESLAMVYMAVVMLGSGSTMPHTHHAAGGIPVLTGVLLVYFAVFALRTGGRLIPLAPPGVPGTAAATGGDLPVPADACRLTLALGSFTMLLGL
ncbi:DUF5134 domain-containing protein [Streptomyces sp. TR02-1]|uniref:DUF5134 domain-containing protein n=1 Tax=Streptomyces sp. TR02-1 TaxID=3385977 RepID=UPI0039A082FE